MSSGFSFGYMGFFNTTVNLGSNAANPPLGSLGLPVTNLRNFLRSSWSSSDMNCSSSIYSLDLVWYPCAGTTLSVSLAMLVHSSSFLCTPHIMSSSSLLVEKGFRVSIGNMALNPFLKADTWIFIVSWNVKCITRSMYSYKLFNVTSIALPFCFNSILSNPGIVNVSVMSSTLAPD